MEGLINEIKIMWSFNMEDALKISKDLQRNTRLLYSAAIGPITSMLENKQSFKHGGGLV
jgi:hypothetical protein